MYIALEGVEGSGKTTIIQLLQETLRNQGHSVTLVKEPGTTEAGEKIRDILLTDFDNQLDLQTELLLFMSARSSMIHTVIKHAKEDYIISDRCYLSSLAYQCNFNEAFASEIYDLHRRLFGKEGLPEKIFFIDINPEASLQRKSQDEINKYEKKAMEFHQKVYHMYKVALKDLSIAIDGTGTPEEITAEILSHLIKKDGVMSFEGK